MSTTTAPTIAIDPAAGITDAHLKVVVAAAIHAFLTNETPNQLTLPPGDTNWAGEGRRAVFHSHKLIKRR